MDVSMAHAVAALASGISVIGAGIGIGLVGFKAMDAIARQPEASKEIRSNMIVLAAMIEGVALFAIVVAIIALFV